VDDWETRGARTTYTARRAGRAVRPGASKRSPARATALIIGGVLVGVAVIAVIVSLVGGGSSGTGTAGNASTTHARASGSGASGKVSPAQMSVVVLNGTQTPNLAHHVSAVLQHSGYSRATALNGNPPGANQVTVVQYASGHRADALRVAGSLGVTQVRPMEAAVASLAGSATVAVIVGADKASSSGGGEASGGGAESSGGGAGSAGGGGEASGGGAASSGAGAESAGGGAASSGAGAESSGGAATAVP